MRRFAVCILLLVSVGAAESRASEAQADETAAQRRAKAAFSTGVEAAAQNDWRRAATHYRVSLEAVYSPQAQYSLAVSLRHLGHFAESLTHFEAFLSRTPPGEHRDLRRAALAVRPELRRQVATLRRGASSKLTYVDGNEVEWGRDNQVYIEPGRRTLRQGRGKEVSIMVRPEETVDLEEFVTATDVDEAPTPTSRVVGWSLVGTGAAVATAGLITGIVGIARSADEREGSASAARARRLAVAGDVTTAIGATAALAGAGVLLFGSTSEESTNNATDVKVVAGPLSLGVYGTF